MKVLMSLLLIHLFLFAIDIKVTPKQERATSQKVQALRDFIKDMTGFVINEKGARKLVEENNILANKYLQKYGLSSYDRSRIKVMIEDYLAKALIDRFQEEILEKNPAIVKSYYLDHLEEFKESDKVDLEVFIFKRYEDGECFYQKAKDMKDEKLLQKIAKECQVVAIKRFSDYSIEKLHPPVSRFIKKDISRYLTPPLVFSQDNVRVVFIRAYKKSKSYKPLEEVQQKVRDLLLREAYLKYRDKVLGR